MKMQVGAEIAQLEQELEERHKNELEELRKDTLETEGSVGGGSGTMEQGMTEMSLTSGTAEESTPQVTTGAGKKSRAQKRKVCHVTDVHVPRLRADILRNAHTCRISPSLLVEELLIVLTFRSTVEPLYCRQLQDSVKCPD